MFYLLNEFISFSPSGAYFVYRNSCFEGMCYHTIADSETRAVRAVLSDEDAASREEALNTVFVRWLSDTEVEYKVGNPYTDEYELKRKSF